MGATKVGRLDPQPWITCLKRANEIATALSLARAQAAHGVLTGQHIPEIKPSGLDGDARTTDEPGPQEEGLERDPTIDRRFPNRLPSQRGEVQGSLI